MSDGHHHRGRGPEPGTCFQQRRRVVPLTLRSPDPPRDTDLCFRTIHGRYSLKRRVDT